MKYLHQYPYACYFDHILMVDFPDLLGRLLLLSVRLLLLSVSLVYKYTKASVSIMTPILIMVYRIHASQPNVCNMLKGFDKGSTSTFRRDPVRNIFKSVNEVD